RFPTGNYVFAPSASSNGSSPYPSSASSARSHYGPPPSFDNDYHQNPFGRQFHDSGGYHGYDHSSAGGNNFYQSDCASPPYHNPDPGNYPWNRSNNHFNGPPPYYGGQDEVWINNCSDGRSNSSACTEIGYGSNKRDRDDEEGLETDTKKQRSDDSKEDSEDDETFSTMDELNMAMREAASGFYYHVGQNNGLLQDLTVAERNLIGSLFHYSKTYGQEYAHSNRLQTRKEKNDAEIRLNDIMNILSLDSFDVDVDKIRRMVHQWLQNTTPGQRATAFNGRNNHAFKNHTINTALRPDTRMRLNALMKKFEKATEDEKAERQQQTAKIADLEAKLKEKTATGDQRDFFKAVAAKADKKIAEKDAKILELEKDSKDHKAELVEKDAKILELEKDSVDRKVELVEKASAILELEKEAIDHKAVLEKKDAKILELEKDLASANALAEKWKSHQRKRATHNKNHYEKSKNHRLQASTSVVVPPSGDRPVSDVGRLIDGYGKMAGRAVQLARILQNQNGEGPTENQEENVDGEDHHSEYASESDES
ncbi:MAG: hypothetical protein SGILL_010387, partial [Bacillariaceae sp.]